MSTKPPRSEKKKNSKRKQAQAHPQVPERHESFVQREFAALLQESDFVSKVIQIYYADALRTFNDGSKHGLVADFEENFSRQEEFIRKYLPVWLCQITEVLALEAFFVASGEPMTRKNIEDFIHFLFLERGPGDPPLKDGRNEIWDRLLLRWALGQVLPTFKVSGAINLASTARKINQLPKRGLLRKMKKTLTGKHLQKLLKDHDIDWPKEKRHYKALLVQGKRTQQIAE